MDLTELAQTYFDDVQKLSQQIADKRLALAGTRGETRHAINRDLLCLYEMRRDCKIVGELLSRYYL